MERCLSQDDTRRIPAHVQGVISVYRNGTTYLCKRTYRYGPDAFWTRTLAGFDEVKTIRLRTTTTTTGVFNEVVKRIGKIL